MAAIHAGQQVTDDLSGEAMAALLAACFRPTTEADVVAAAQAVIVCVSTPRDDSDGWDLANVRSA